MKTSVKTVRKPAVSLALVLSALLGVAAVTSVSALPRDEMQQRGPHYSQMDSNGDGKISQAEHEAFHQERVEARFKWLDSDGDGNVSKQEFLNSHQERKMERFKAMDQNGDGFITQDERRAMKRDGKYAGKANCTGGGSGPRN